MADGRMVSTAAMEEAAAPPASHTNLSIYIFESFKDSANVRPDGLDVIPPIPRP